MVGREADARGWARPAGREGGAPRCFPLGPGSARDEPRAVLAGGGAAPGPGAGPTPRGTLRARGLHSRRARERRAGGLVCARGPGAGPPRRRPADSGAGAVRRGRVQRGRGAPGRREGPGEAPDNERGGSALRTFRGRGPPRLHLRGEGGMCGPGVPALKARSQPDSFPSRVCRPRAADLRLRRARPHAQTPRWPAPEVSKLEHFEERDKRPQPGVAERAPSSSGGSSSSGPEGTGSSPASATAPRHASTARGRCRPELGRRPRRRASTGGTATSRAWCLPSQRPLGC